MNFIEYGELCAKPLKAAGWLVLVIRITLGINELRELEG